jgi:hypothetical protein
VARYWRSRSVIGKSGWLMRHRFFNFENPDRTRELYDELKARVGNR